MGDVPDVFAEVRRQVAEEGISEPVAEGRALLRYAMPLFSFLPIELWGGLELAVRALSLIHI